MIEADVPRVVELAHASFLDSKYADLTFDFDGLTTLLHVSLQSDAVQVFVCTNTAGRVIGAIGAIITKNPWFKEMFASEQLFTIEKASRGFAPAMLLLNAYKNWAAVSGARVLCVLADSGECDSRTARLYQRAGFVPSGFALAKRI